MPPAKVRTLHEDSRPDVPTGKDKLQGLTQTTSAPRGNRKTGNGGMTNGSSLKEVVSTSDVAAMDGFGGSKNQSGSNNGVAWIHADRSLLHEYRYAHRLDTPSTFKSSMSPIIMGSSEIGKYSPTMVRRRNQRRVQRDQLVTAVRKNFNAQPISENDVIVALMYKSRHQDKTFRLQFAPNRNR